VPPGAVQRIGTETRTGRTPPPALVDVDGVPGRLEQHRLYPSTLAPPVSIRVDAPGRRLVPVI
jgi:hypothetical protein